MKITFTTLGCKVNQYETEALRRLFEERGWQVVSPGEAADVCVVNSCTVTAEGDRKTRQVLRRMRRSHPDAVIALAGCYPQAFPAEAEALEEADLVIGSKGKSRLPALVERVLQSGNRLVEIERYEAGEAFEAMTAGGRSERTRAFLKIEDGCECYCAYCIIPTARGPVRSRPLAAIEAELRSLAEAGFKEVVLTGINLSMYGRDFGLRLPDAVAAACHTPGIERVRLGSLEPELITEADIDRMAAEEKLCPQFHLALQSGCDATLCRMNRHYTTDDYRRFVEQFRRRFDNAAITTDIMVGFPGETEAEFAASLAFAREIGFARMHVFNYSRRAGTMAAMLPGQVPAPVREERSHRMGAVARENERAFLEGQRGRELEVLFESRAEGTLQLGYARNYTPVGVRSAEELAGTIRRVAIDGIEGGLCLGRLL